MKQIKNVDTREDLYNMIPKGGVGAEIGVCRGQNAVQLFFRARPSVLHLVDIWKDFGIRRHDEPQLWYKDYSEVVRNLFEEEIESGQVQVHKAYSVSWLHHLEDESLDWVYLDANHHYQSASRELNHAIKKVKKGGLILGHDYSSTPERWGSSVIRAVNERIQNGNLEMTAITKEKWPSYMTEVK